MRTSGRREEALSAYKKAAMVAAYGGNASVALMVRITLANVAFAFGQPESALLELGCVSSEAQAKGALRAQWTALVNYAEIAQSLGRVDEAVSVLETVLAAPRLRRFQRLWTAAMDQLADAHRSRGDHAGLHRLSQRRRPSGSASGLRLKLVSEATVDAMESLRMDLPDQQPS